MTASVGASPSSVVAAPSGAATSSAARIPWFIWLAVVGVTSAMVGVQWDISWHRSIGRDTFWIPAHIAIQLCGVIAGITCGYLILWTTFTKSPLRAASVSVLGFRAPLGAFITAWGGFTMITSAPFDDWWHNAYGLDVKILSPPHVVLAYGLFAVEIGTLLLIAGRMNNAVGGTRRRLEYLFLYISAMLLIAGTVFVLEFTGRIWLHSALAYRVICLLVPVSVSMAPRATGNRWAATIVTGIYTVFLLGLEWILPLFPAQPKLGPVLHQVTHFIPNGFPLLLIVPAFAIDLIRPRVAHLSNFRQALVLGPVFLAVLLSVQWPFATFLQSPAARNAFFGSGYFDFFAAPDSYQATWRFIHHEKTSVEFALGLLIAAICAILTTWLGLVRGDWLGRVRR